ncbi:MAG: hypothetical protein IKC42_03380, partial [Alistipes sp.]|nr:hypothetical protein [Alistipes sp.]
SKYLKLLSYYSVETQFDVTIDNGVAAIIATNSTGSSKQMIYNHSNSSATSRYFACYSSTDAGKAVCIYRLVGAKRTIPTVEAHITVPKIDEKVIISEDATQTATAIDEVIFDYVGDWTISVSDDADWLTVAYNAEKITYTAEANTDTSAARSATVTITASRGEETLVPWTFTIEQKKAPTVISIADFAVLSKDLTAVYKLTGKVKTLATSSSTAYVLEDENGNVANIKYLYTEAGDAVWGHDDIDVKVGDVITVTTVPMGSKNGGSSTYHSIYKGYYRLTAKASPELIGYEGGSATITLATEGNMLPVDGVINGAPAEEYDFVTFNYTANAATATVTFATNSGGSRNAIFDFTYGATSVSVKIGQKNHPSVKTGWFLVTNLSELAVGDKVIIAAKSVDETIDYAIKTYTSSNPSSNPAIEIELQGDSISSVEGVEQFTLESGLADYAGTWAFKCDSQSRYLNVTSGSLKLKSTLAQEGSWTIDIAADGKATLVSKTTNTKTTIMFNDAQASKTFASYAPTQTGRGAIYLYKEYK